MIAIVSVPFPNPSQLLLPTQFSVAADGVERKRVSTVGAGQRTPGQIATDPRPARQRYWTDPRPDRVSDVGQGSHFRAAVAALLQGKPVRPAGCCTCGYVVVATATGMRAPAGSSERPPV